MDLKKFRKKSGQTVLAIQIDLDTDGFTYRKWGDIQRCRAGDWLVLNDGDTYTIDREVFANTYRQQSAGFYEKIAPVWARRAEADGSVQTKEGRSHYKAGDYIVANHPDGSDAWCMRASKFNDMYEPVSES